jgi:hypothetical protein
MLEQSSHGRQSSSILWGVLAVINLSAGLFIAAQPGRDSDLLTVRDWVASWLASGTDLYRDQISHYPPNAFLTFAPLAFVSASHVTLAWALLNVAMAVLATYLAVRTVRADISPRDAALPMAMFLCWGGFRSLLQFSLFSVWWGLMAIILSRRRPVWSGLSLALALAKPHIGVPFVLWMLFTRHLRALGVAAAAVTIGCAAYCLRAQANPVQVVTSYVETLRGRYMGDGAMTGLAQLRPLITATITGGRAADALATAIAVVLLGFVCWLGFAEARRGHDQLYSAPALAGVWSLLTFYHLTYGFILLLPAAALLLLDVDEDRAVFRRRTFWILQLGLMADVPGLWRRAGPRLPAPAWLTLPIMQADRVLMILLFAALSVLALGRLRMSHVMHAYHADGPDIEIAGDTRR